MSIKTVSLKDDPSLYGRINELETEAFAEYLSEEPTWEKCFPKILETFPEYQLFFIDENTDELLALSNQVPFYWDGDAQTLPGYNDLLQGCLDEAESGVEPTALCGIMAITSNDHKARGLSEYIFSGIKNLTEKYKLEHCLSPLRPTLKHLYPNFSIEQYISWKDASGRPFDPWLRSGQRANITFIGIAYNSIAITDTVTQWEKWTNMKFPVSGEYIIPDGHQLLQVDVENDTASYAEHHVWYST